MAKKKVEGEKTRIRTGTTLSGKKYQAKRVTDKTGKATYKSTMVMSDKMGRHGPSNRTVSKISTKQGNVEKAKYKSGTLPNGRNYLATVSKVNGKTEHKKTNLAEPVKDPHLYSVFPRSKIYEKEQVRGGKANKRVVGFGGDQPMIRKKINKAPKKR